MDKDYNYAFMKFSKVICVFFLVFFMGCGTAPKKKTICLNMIVKNESQVIEKCLASAKPLIDYWVIVDTGSDDNTQEIVKKCLKGIPGELHEKPWVNFAHNRNEALALAKNKGDYVLLIDADEILQISDDFSLPVLEKDLYYIPVREVGLAEFKRNGLINNHLNWNWQGVVHEDLICAEMKSSETLKGIVNLCNTNPKDASGRSKQSDCEKYLRDAENLEKALKEEPMNSRYAYYLGVSYGMAGQLELAKKSFEKRISMPSNNSEETFMGLYYLGVVQVKLNDFDGALKTFSQAYTFRPTRAEPLFCSAIINHMKGNVSQAYQFVKQALSLPYPQGDNFVMYVAYDYEMLVELTKCSMELGKFQEGFDTCTQLLANPRLPSEQRTMIQAHYEHARQMLLK
jgi:glycosyltransferase involved in cell wall biosynthesis